jgi:hypothetical protein
LKPREELLSPLALFPSRSCTSTIRMSRKDAQFRRRNGNERFLQYNMKSLIDDPGKKCVTDRGPITRINLDHAVFRQSDQDKCVGASDASRLASLRNQQFPAPNIFTASSTASRSTRLKFIDVATAECSQLLQECGCEKATLDSS